MKKIEDNLQKIKDYRSFDEVDWSLVTENLFSLCRILLRNFSASHPYEQIYGAVVQSGQNWELTIHLNTEEGWKGMPEKFRKENEKWWGEKSDQEIYDSLGRWYYDAWQYHSLDFEYLGSHPDINQLHNEAFEKIRYQSEVEKDAYDRFTLSCAKAFNGLISSSELRSLNQTSDFEIRFHDSNSLEWDTEELLAKAKENN